MWLIPLDFPPNYVGGEPLQSESRTFPLTRMDWNTITDAMGRVLLPEGTAQSAHIPGIDIAGKTGSAQVVSLATRAKHAHDEALAQNGWFVGFTPRRNPDIVVCTLFEGGEHGKLAARIGDPGDQGYRRQAAAAADECGRRKVREGVEVGALLDIRRVEEGASEKLTWRTSCRLKYLAKKAVLCRLATALRSGIELQVQTVEDS